MTFIVKIYQMLGTIWYHLYDFKKRKKHLWRNFTLSKVQAYFAKSNVLPWVFYTFLKLYKCYQIAQRILWKLTASGKVILDTVLK